MCFGVYVGERELVCEQHRSRIGSGKRYSSVGHHGEQRSWVVREMVDVFDKADSHLAGEIDFDGATARGQNTEIDTANIISDRRIEGAVQSASTRGEHTGSAAVYLGKLVLELLDGGGGGDYLGGFVLCTAREFGQQGVVVRCEYSEFFSDEM